MKIEEDSSGVAPDKSGAIPSHLPTELEKQVLPDQIPFEGGWRAVSVESVDLHEFSPAGPSEIRVVLIGEPDVVLGDRLWDWS